jgi:hypothetical protein
MNHFLVLKTPLKCKDLGYYLISNIPAHLAAIQLQHFSLVHQLFLLTTKNVLYKLLNKSFITILYFCRLFELSCLNYTVLSSTMTNPPLLQLSKGGGGEREGGGKKFIFSFANLCRISAPLEMERDDP